MNDARLYRLLRKVADVRSDEVRSALFLFFQFFLITFTFYIIKAIKESFVIGVNPAWWPYADLITAVLIGFVIAFNARLLARLPRRTYASSTLIFFASNLLFFWFVFWLNTRRTFIIGSLLPLAQRSWVPFVFIFSFWSDIFIAMSVTQFWIGVNDFFNPHQAKRLIGFLVTGGLLGGIGGSLLTSRLVHLINPVNLILVCPAILLLMLVLVNLLHKERETTRAGSEADKARAGTGIGYLESFRTVRGNRYLRILAGVLASAMVIGQLVKYQFNFMVKAQGWDKSTQTSFIATFFLAILVLSTVFHLATTGQVLKKFGIRLALLVAPSVLLLGSLAVFLIPASGLLVWACLLRGTDRAFDTTISQSVRELLYIPVPADIKYKAKIFIDMFVNKFGAGLGAALYFLAYHTLSFAMYQEARPSVPIRYLGILVVGFTLVWITLIWIIYAEYLSVVKKDLTRKWQDATGVVKQHVDMDVTRLIFDTVQSREKSSTLYVMNLFQLVKREKLTPELMEILDYQENEMKARSMDSLLDVGGEVFYRGVEETLSDKDFEVQVREIMALDSFKLLMGRRLAEIVGKETASEVERMEAARLIGQMEPSPDVFHSLESLLRDLSPDVLNYALSSAAVHLRKEHVPLIIPLLGNPMNRQAAQDVLEAYGPRIEDVLRKHLQDAGERLEVRQAIPEVLARIGNQRAADVLTGELARGEEDLEQELTDALYKIRSNQPKVRFKVAKIRAAILSLIKKNYEALLAEGDSRPARGDCSVSGPDVKAALDLRTKRIFDLLALIHPPEDIVTAYQNILQGSKKSVDYSLELLDNILDRDLKVYLSPLIEDLPPEERIRRLKKLARGLGIVPP
ncbi:MAG: MFS transporter [Candidatus Aminicenantales bacterium]